MNGTNHSYICICICCTRKIPSDRFTTVLVFKSWKKDYLWITLKPNAIENIIYQNTWKGFFLHKLNLCWEKIDTSSLIHICVIVQLMTTLLRWVNSMLFCGQKEETLIEYTPLISRSVLQEGFKCFKKT